MRRSILWPISLLCFFGIFATSFAEEKSFAVVVVARDFTETCLPQLKSILQQRYQHHRVIYIADGWEEEKAIFFQKQIETLPSKKKVTFFKNREQRGHLACMCQAVFSCNPEEVVIEIAKGTLWQGAFILTQLNRWYRDDDFWMTCGSSGRGFVSFYADLFHQIRKEDFLEAGRFISGGDAACYLFPMLQMAQSRAHYVSGNENGFEFLVRGEKILGSNQALEEFLREGVEGYDPLEKLPSAFRKSFAEQWVEDFLHPSSQDYRSLQRGLALGERKNLERLDDMLPLMRNIKLIGESVCELPLSGAVAVNCEEEDRDCCLLVYATFNRNYPRGFRRLLDWIINSDFKGHVLYRLGGWPDTEGGSLSLAHVPYGFKPAFFKEAQRMGFKKVLWLDVAVVPLVSLNAIFEMIQERGYFVMGNSPHCVGSFMHPVAAVYFGLTLSQASTIPSCSAGLFGLDFTHTTACRLFDDWYRAAFDEDAFFSKRSDQNALSILLDRYGFYELTDIRRMPHSETGEAPQEDSLFYLDRRFVQ